MRFKVTYVSHMGHIYYSKRSIPNIFSNTLASEKCAFVALLVLRQVVNPSSLSLMHVCNSKTIKHSIPFIDNVIKWFSCSRY